MPVPETASEKAAVKSAQQRWDEEFYLVGEGDGRESAEDLPDYVTALLPQDCRYA